MHTETIELSGYDDRKELMAQRYDRAGNSLFVVALPLYLIPRHLPIPDPDEPFEGNRTVNAKRAADFGEYWRQNERWATPPLLLDTTYPLSTDFEPRMSVGDVDFGVLRLPYNSESELQILDGQHRILGWTFAARKISAELKAARDRRLRALRVDSEPGVAAAELEIAALEEQQRRLHREFVTVEILEGVTLDDHKQYFHDIATNAKGITKSLTASFDRRSSVNRVAMDLALEHPLLKERVDFESDTLRGQNENWISGKNLTDVVTTLAIGAGASLTTRRKAQLQDEPLTAVTEAFFTALAEEFADLRRLAAGEKDGADLRGRTLLASPTIIRGLAGAYFDLAVDTSTPGVPVVSHLGDGRARRLFSDLASHMELPVDDLWFSTELFPERTSQAPSSRSQDLRALVQAMVAWGRAGSLPS